MRQRFEGSFGLAGRFGPFAYRKIVDGDELPATGAGASTQGDAKQRRGRGLASALLLLSCWGCRSLVDADAFAVGGEGGNGTESAADPLAWAPASCASCATTECSEELATCSDAPECARSGACFAAQPSPAQRLRCALRNPGGQFALTALNRCVATRCTAACRGEAAWGCLDADPSVSEAISGPVKLEATYLDILDGDHALAGLTVQVCDRGPGTDACEETLDRATTDGSGTARLAVPDISEVRDAFIKTTGEELYPELRFHSTPIVVDTAIRVSGVTRGAFQLISAVSGVAELEGHGSLSVTVFDCVGAPAQGVAIEAMPIDEETVRFYSKGQLDLDRELEQTQSDGIAVLANVPAGTVTVRAVHVATRRVINEVRVSVADRARSTLALEPKVERP